jgi:sugar phosphate isomerase/epimerase
MKRLNDKIELGVSLYSLTSEFVTGKMSLEDCLKTVSEMGFKGVEIVAAQTVPEYPNPSDKWLFEFSNLLAKYGLTPVCYSAYIDNGLRPDRDLNRDEIVQFTYNDMLYAKKAGFKIVRTQHSISPQILEEMVPACEKLDIMLTIEMHHPHHPRVDVWEKYLELMNKYEHLGVVPDFSIFQHKPHRLLVERLVRAGFREDKLNRVLEYHEKGIPCEDAAGDLSLTALETRFAQDLYEKFNPTPLDDLKMLVPVAPYIHGKFYILDNGDFDPCVPYDKILPMIRDLGFKGYIAAEYEGHHFDLTVDTKRQLLNYASIFDKYIN